MSRTFRYLMLLVVLLCGGNHAFASSQATIQVNGAEQSGDASSITISFADSAGHTYSETISYGPFSTQASVASAIGGMFANTYVPSGQLSAQVFCGTTNTVVFTLKGSAAFGSLTVTGSNTSFQLASSGFASSGSKTTPNITWPTPGAITYGTALSATQLDATATAPGTGASVEGTYSYSPAAGTMLSAGSQNLQVIFTPSNTTAFTQATATVMLTVSQATQIVLPGRGIINTIAGNGTEAYSGDGGPAINAELYYPGTVAVDSAGNIYIADTAIRKVTAATGAISTIAGNGSDGNSGNGGPAVDAELYDPSIALDSAGDIYLADLGNNAVRVIYEGGVVAAGLIRLENSNVTPVVGNIYAIAGNGTQGYSGDGGLATSAELSGPYDAQIDSAGNIYIEDVNNNVIRKITASTGVISTIVGNGVAAYSGDGGPATSAELNNQTDGALDSAGSIYIADTFNNAVRVVYEGGAVAAALIHLENSDVTPVVGNIYTIAGNGTQGYSGDGGLATGAELSFPDNVTVDGAGNVYIADTQNNVLRKVNASTGLISTIAGNGIEGFSGDGGPAISAQLNIPAGMAIDAGGNVYFADNYNARVRVVGSGLAASGVSIFCSPGTFTYGSSTTCTATVAGSSPTGTVTFSYNNNSWTSCTLSSGSCSVSGLSSVAAGSYTIAGNYSGDSSNASANGSTTEVITQATQTITFGELSGVTYGVNPITLAAAASSGLPVSYTVTGPATVSGPTLTVTGSGTVTVTASQAGNSNYTAATSVQQSFNVSQATPTLGLVSSGSPSTYGSAVTFTATISDIVTGTITFYDGSASIGSGVLSGGTATLTTNSLSVGAHSITASWAGNADYDAVTSSAITQAVDGRGILGPDIINTVAGVPATSCSAGYGSWSCNFSGELGDGVPANQAQISANQVAVDMAGNIYVGSTYLREVTASTGTIATVAGGGTGCPQETDSFGDGCLATEAIVSGNSRAAVDAMGNIYIADTEIREVTAATGVITVFAGGGNGCSQQTDSIGDGCPALDANLNGTSSVALDTVGNVYFTDTANVRIRKVTAATGVITTIAGGGAGCPQQTDNIGDGCPALNAILNGPSSVAVDIAGNIYLADTGSLRIRMISAATGIITTVAGGGADGIGGQATSASIGTPSGLAVDSAGNIYFSVAGYGYIGGYSTPLAPNGAIFKVSASSGIISMLAGNGSGCTQETNSLGDGCLAINGMLWAPNGLAVDGTGNIFIADTDNGVIRVVGAPPQTQTQTPSVAVSCSPNPNSYDLTSVCQVSAGSGATGTVSLSWENTGMITSPTPLVPVTTT